MQDLFSNNVSKSAPLADRMRPQTLDEFIGQRHIVGEGCLLRRAIKIDALQSSIFWGPPGCGKTTLASIIANTTRSNFVKLNAVTSGVKEVREVIAEAENNLRLYGKETFLLLDECHRWSKAQSDSVLPALEAATDAFIAQREAEGGRLSKDIQAKCAEIKSNVDFIESRSAQLIGEYEKKLRARIEELLSDVKVDEQRLLTEVAIMADRIAIDEELVRLNSHCKTLADMFADGVSNGKKMDFFIQEMNREANTISSKIGDLEVTSRVIEIKTCIEKIREQIQNVE